MTFYTIVGNINTTHYSLVPYFCHQGTQHCSYNSWCWNNPSQFPLHHDYWEGEPNDLGINQLTQQFSQIKCDAHDSSRCNRSCRTSFGFEHPVIVSCQGKLISSCLVIMLSHFFFLHQLEAHHVLTLDYVVSRTEPALCCDSQHKAGSQFWTQRSQESKRSIISISHYLQCSLSKFNWSNHKYVRFTVMIHNNMVWIGAYGSIPGSRQIS